LHARLVSLRRFAALFIGVGLVCAVLGSATNSHAQVRVKVRQPTSANAMPQYGLINWFKGQSNAPVSIVEYGSLTCGACAAFNNSVMPAIKRRYIDTGLVRFTLRPLPTPPFDLSVAMHALAICAGPTRYYPLIDAYFLRQPDVMMAAMGETGPKGTILAIAEDFGGLSYSAGETCLRGSARQNQVRVNAQAGANLGVVSTPTLFINGTMLSVPAGQPLNEAFLGQAIDAALRARVPVAKGRRQ
jgi:protein-disulfide isomerase